MSLLEIAGHHHIGNSSPIFCLTSSLFPQTVQTSKTDETKFLSALPFAPPKLLATILQDFNRCSALVRGRVRYKPTYWNNLTGMWDRKLLISGYILLKMNLFFLSPTPSLITFFHCLLKTKTCEDWKEIVIPSWLVISDQFTNVPQCPIINTRRIIPWFNLPMDTETLQDACRCLFCVCLYPERRLRKTFHATRTKLDQTRRYTSVFWKTKNKQASTI